VTLIISQFGVTCDIGPITLVEITTQSEIPARAGRQRGPAGERLTGTTSYRDQKQDYGHGKPHAPSTDPIVMRGVTIGK
jgi:hypothetical protein